MSTAPAADADTIRILIATDNHVGYEESDPIRTDDSWKAFDEIMSLARTQDVDMVLLAGDLFHYDKPSRKSVFQVMRSLRKNCLGMKPCELQFLSDAGEVFDGRFGHVNYEDPDINISIPVFSIHGNHDEPSGEGNYCALDLLQVAGLVNYFGRATEVDNIHAKPVLLQKGQTKLALFGLSNVRDDRMFRTFREGKVKWFRPNVQSSDWFNLIAVHQNHHAHTATGYLPEEFLPNWLDLVVWGHEHECKIEPSQNPETGFHVMQPGSSVATSLVPGEAVAKHVAIVSVKGRDFEVEKHRLKSVRPFITKEIDLKSDKRFKGLEKKKENRTEITRRLMAIVEEMIDEANAEWHSIQDEDIDPSERPLPLVRLKVEYTAPEGGQFDIENPQRFSGRFQDKVANTKDVLYCYRKKKLAKREKAQDLPEEVLAKLEEADIDVNALVEEFLAAQSLKILPQAPFGDAVTEFVNKNDRRAMENFIANSLEDQVKQMLTLEDNDDLDNAMEQIKKKLENEFAEGNLKQYKRRNIKPKPDMWDSDMDGHWEDQPEALIPDEPAPAAAKKSAAPARGRARKAAQEEDDEDMQMNDVIDDEEEEEAPAPKTRGRPKAAAPPAKAPAKAPSKAPAKSTAKAPAKKPAATGRGRKKQVFEESEDDDDDAFMDVEEDEKPAPPPKRTTASRSTTQTRTQPSRATSAAKPRQTKLSFSSQKATQQDPLEISDDEISDPFEEAQAPRSRRK